MQTTPAMIGWTWAKQGIALFRKQPAELISVFLAYLFFMFAVALLPLLGKILPFLLTPVFSMAFMQAGVQVEQERRVYPGVLLTGFRSAALPGLCILGLFYLLAAYLAAASSTMIDGGIFWKVIHGEMKLDPKLARESGMPMAMQFAGMVYSLALLPLWFAAPLMAWKNMSVGKAIFYSVVTVKRGLRAFVVYGLSWVVITGILPSLISSVIALLFGPLPAIFVLLALWVVLTMAMYCSFYPTYTYTFGKPYPTAQQDHPTL